MEAWPWPDLALPAPLERELWHHARRAAPDECVGLLGGSANRARTLYPLVNVAPDPRRVYLADAVGVIRALRAMRREGLDLVGIYHSHPEGPSHFSAEDARLAHYAVPYLIADVRARTLRAFLLPEGLEVRITAEPVAVVSKEDAGP